MTIKRQTDIAIIKQMRYLHHQATEALNTLGVEVRVDIDNATLVAMWRSTQVCEIKGKKFNCIAYNN